MVARNSFAERFVYKTMEKYKSLSFDEEKKIIKASGGKTKKKIASEIGIPPSTLSTIVKNKSAIVNSSKVQKRNKKAEFPELDKCVLTWVKQCRANKINLSGKFLQEKAIIFANFLGKSKFKCSNDWLEKFNKRHGITFRKVCGKSGSVSEATCDDWKIKLKEILQKYKAEDIFNTDETGLFFKCLPDSTLCFKEKCSGGKKSKERVTVMVGVFRHK